MIDDGSWGIGAAGEAAALPTPEAYGLRGMVASAHPTAAQIGVSILQRGGTAIDAAIAVAAAEGVLLPMMCGLGGDAFVLVHDARRGETLAYSGSGVAAAGVSADYYRQRGFQKMPLEGVHSISVPGAVAVYEAIWKRHGSLPWADLWQPAIDLAQNGVAITAHTNRRIADREEALGRYEHSRAQYLVDGRAPATGSRWRAPNLARSLGIVAAGGADAFYRGEIAQRIVGFLNAEGAPFALEDFTRQQATVSAPLQTSYRGLTVCQTTLMSQGFMMLEQLNLLDGFNLEDLDALGTDRVHLTIEAKKLAFEDRNRHARDPFFGDWPLDRLISRAYADEIRGSIDLQHAREPRTLVAEHSGDTSYFTVADGQGNAVSFIHSLSASFGSAVVAGDSGIALNNRAGRGFSLVEGHPNEIAPGKRTVHTLNAYMVLRDGKPWLVGGTPGGDQQTQWNVQCLGNVVDHGMTLQQAIDAPRWYSFPGTDPANAGLPPVVRIERRMPPETVRGLAERGHTVEPLGAWSGGGSVQMIELGQDGVLRGGSDPRAGGVALGW
ncbi:MAG: gamma-glutamyltransferase [Chloroflexota bacterium]